MSSANQVIHMFKKTTKHYILGISMLFILSCTFVNKKERSEIAAEMDKSARKNLIDVWYPKAVDTLYGGFLSTFNYKFEPVEPQDKMIVTQARHIWSNSKASIFFKDPAYKHYAAHGVKFLRDVMWDETYGGFYTLVNRQG